MTEEQRKLEIQEEQEAQKKKERRQKLSRCLFSLLAVAILLSPWLRSQIFVISNAGWVEKFYAQEKELPDRLEEKVSVFEGEHDMVQFALYSLTVRYTGCYYSPDDVPLPFQNAAGVSLQPNGEDSWVWEDETGNHGETRKLRDCWYYYKAWF